MESLRRLTSSIFDSERLSLGRRGSISSGILSPTSEAAAHAAQGFAPSDLDITFITNRLIVMGFPVQGPTDKKRNLNNIDDLAEYLEMHHSNQYMIFNLNSLENDVSALEHLRDLDSLSLLETLASSPTSADERKQTSVIAEKVRQQMVEFAWERDGMKAHTPPFDHIFRICYAIFAWLSLDASNVALINCQTGKTRSGIVVASYLLYARLADDPIEAFVEFYRKRWGMKSLTSEALRQKTPQSIQRFLTCFHDLIDNQRIPNDKPIVLKGIIIRSIPVEFQPCIQIWDDHRLIFCTSDGPPQADHSPVQDRPAIDWECEDGCLAILWDDGFDLDGGFSIMCSFGEEYDADDSSIDPSTKVLFRYADSTWFLAPGLITLTKSRLDIMKQYEDAFNDEYFAMDLVFVESKKPQRKYIPIDYTGNAAVRQGVIEITKQHVVLPDPGMHSNFMKMGFSDAATTFALQRSQNAPNIALDILHSSVIATCFRQDPKLSGRTRPALQSYSSASILGKQQLHGGKTGASEPLVRRQSTAEIAALQSQRAHHNTPVAEVASVCIVCKDDDYIMRPQIVRCRGACGNVYHTTCAGLKRIPFGLTTLSDRTNHSVYVKKYFNAWECDSCAAAHLSRQQDVHPHEHQSLRGPYAISSFSSRLAQTTLQTDRVRTTVPAAQHSTVNVTVNASDTAGDGQVEKLMDFLAVSGVSVEDLLRAATTANVAISPSGGATELSKGPNASDEGSSPSSGTLHKLVDVQENPQDSAPNSESAQPVDYKQKTGSSRICPSDAPRKQAVSAPAHEAPASGRSFLLADIAARTKCKGDEQIASANEVSTPEEAPSVTLKPASTLDPKAALLAQIATRSQRVDQEPRVDLQSPQTHEQLLEDSMKKQEAVRSCTTKDRVDPGGQATLPVTDKKDEGEEMPQAVPSQTKLKDMQEFSSYFNMLRIGCPKPAVTQKMLMDGMDPVVLELGPDALYEEVKDKIKIASSAEASTLQDDIKSVKSYKKVPKPSEADQPSPPPHEIEAVSTTKEIALKDHETYSKYFKMLKMGLPEDAVRHKIQRDGLDDRALILGGDAPFSKLSEKPAEIRLADDPVYSKYFKMLKMGLPKDAVCHKMALESVDARALELGPDAFVSQLVVSKVQTASSLAKTKVRRKKLHWQPISDDRLSSDRHTIWEDKDDDGVEFDMDMDEIESLFFASSDRGTKKNSTVQSKAMKRKQSVTLIDGKRAMNAAISLARVKLSYAEIAHAISVFDAKGLTVDQLRGIREFLPTAEEAALVTSYSGDVTLLGEAEKFIMEISNVKRYTVRAECLLFRISFASKHEELSVSVGNLIDACQQVKESRLLKTLLGTVLKLGNTLNGSGDDNEIRGFTVDSLLRLGHTKAVNQKTTVLHYLIRLLKKNHPAVLDFQSELKNVALAARESFEAVDEDFGKLQSGLTLLSEEFQELQKDEMDNETVVSLQAAVEDIGGQMELLDQRIKHARDEVQSVLEYFGEDPAKNLSSFFTTLASFCSMFETARKEVDTADEAQQRAERMKLRRNASLRPSPKPVSSLKGVRIDRERAMSDRGLLNGQATPRISENDVA